MTGKSLVTFFWKADLESLVAKARGAGTPEYELDAIPSFATEGIKNYQFSRPVVGTVGRAISAKVKDKERAVQFLDYLVSEEGRIICLWASRARRIRWRTARRYTTRNSESLRLMRAQGLGRLV